MAYRPAKLLSVFLSNVNAVGPYNPQSTTDPFAANPYNWTATLNVTPQGVSQNIAGTGYFYTGVDIYVGDQIVTQGQGRVLTVASIQSATDNVVQVTLTDVNQENTYQDGTGNGDGGIPTGAGFLYEIKNGMPILYPLPDSLPGTLPDHFGTQLFAKAFYDMNGFGATEFLQLSDVVPKTYSGAAGKFLAINSAATGIEFVTAPSGGGGGTSNVVDFTNLADVPQSYTGEAGKILAVNSTATGLAFVNMPSGGGTGGNVLQTPDNGDTTFSGAISDWTIGTTTYSDAIDDLNKVLGLLVPNPPPKLKTETLSITGGSTFIGSTAILLSTGVTDNTLLSASSTSTLNPGSQVYMIEANPVMSNTVVGFGSTTGTLTAMVSNTASGVITLSNTVTPQTVGSLTITSVDPFPVTQPGFWLSLSAQISATVPEGINCFQMSHSLTGKTNTAYFVIDPVVLPTVSAGTVASIATETVFSSGVPHYTTGAKINVAYTASNLSTDTYLEHGVCGITSTPTISPDISYDPGQSTLPPILQKGLQPQNISGTLKVTGNLICKSNVTILANNCHGSASSVIPTNILIMSGTVVTADAIGPIQEMSIPVINLGTTPASAPANGFRVLITNGGVDQPTYVGSALTSTSWQSMNPLAMYDASVVAGILSCDVTNYASVPGTPGLYLPPGPDYSSHHATQYATFAFVRSAVSKFKIIIKGTYAGLWVSLSGVNFPNTTNNWLDMFQLYSGTGTPGTGTNGAGCAYGSTANGQSGTFTCTFGQQTSSNSPNNLIIVRIKLTTGQKITGLAFSS